jgi:hypothetical protein
VGCHFVGIKIMLHTQPVKLSNISYCCCWDAEVKGNRKLNSFPTNKPNASKYMRHTSLKIPFSRLVIFWENAMYLLKII